MKTSFTLLALVAFAATFAQAEVTNQIPSAGNGLESTVIPLQTTDSTTGLTKRAGTCGVLETPCGVGCCASGTVCAPSQTGCCSGIICGSKCCETACGTFYGTCSCPIGYVNVDTVGKCCPTGSTVSCAGIYCCDDGTTCLGGGKCSDKASGAGGKSFAASKGKMAGATTAAAALIAAGAAVFGL